MGDHSQVSHREVGSAGVSSSETIIPVEISGCAGSFEFGGTTYGGVVIGSQCWLDKDLGGGAQHTWASAQTARPAGWRVPTDEDWIALERHLGLPEGELYTVGNRGTTEGDALKAGGASGFEAVITETWGISFWTATTFPDDATYAFRRRLVTTAGTIARTVIPKSDTSNVRCLAE